MVAAAPLRWGQCGGEGEEGGLFCSAFGVAGVAGDADGAAGGDEGECVLETFSVDDVVVVLVLSPPGVAEVVDDEVVPSPPPLYLGRRSGILRRIRYVDIVLLINYAEGVLDPASEPLVGGP